MAKLVIIIEESQEDAPDGQLVGYSIYDSYEGELFVGSTLPGIRPVVLRAVKCALDFIYGGHPASESDISLEDARAKIRDEVTFPVELED